MSTKRVWCVAWWPDCTPKKDDDAREWCATFRGHEPGYEFCQRTACGAYVGSPVGAEKRVPTCKECKARVKRRR